MEPAPSRSTSAIFMLLRPSSTVISTGTSITNASASRPRGESFRVGAPPADTPSASARLGRGAADASGFWLCAGRFGSFIPAAHSFFVPASDLDGELTARHHRHALELGDAGDPH